MGLVGGWVLLLDVIRGRGKPPIREGTYPRDWKLLALPKEQAMSGKGQVLFLGKKAVSGVTLERVLDFAALSLYRTSRL